MEILFYILAALMLIMSLAALIAYKKDKEYAKQSARRTPEKTLLLLSACFGGIGAFAGMKLFRHKTKHLSFQIIVPVTMILQIALLAATAYLAFLR
ncbi:MAG: DUF1294 domain-containing protein [Clostridia bacterium]|nr:DUF1294 domain-containing protein [Clostridia bacterium]